MKHKIWLLAIASVGLLVGCGAGQPAAQTHVRAQEQTGTNVSSSGVSSKVSSKAVQNSQSEVNTVNSLQQSLSKGENDLQLNK